MDGGQNRYIYNIFYEIDILRVSFRPNVCNQLVQKALDVDSSRPQPSTAVNYPQVKLKTTNILDIKGQTFGQSLTAKDAHISKYHNLPI